MGKMGKDTHMKSLAAPPSYRIRRSRSGRVFVARPLPGPHKLEMSLPLYLVLRDLIGVAETARESKKIIKSGKVLVDGRVVKQPNWPVGLMDVISMNGVGEKYRMLVNRKGQLILVKAPEEEAVLKPCKVLRKSTVKGGALRLTLHDGRVLPIQPEAATLNVGDSALLEVPKLNLKGVARVAEGSVGYCYRGKSAGLYGKIEHVTEPAFKRPSMVSIRTPGGDLITTIKDYVFVVGSDSPWISLGGY